MKPIFKSRRRLLLLITVVMALAAIVGGTLLIKYLARTPLERAVSGFDDEDRLRYRAALEKLRYELRTGPGSPAFETVMDRDKLLAAIALDDKKMRLLREKCDLEISDEMLEAEYERLKADPGDLRVLAAIADALDRDPAALIEFWLRPTLVDRYLRACVSMDENWNAPARARIGQLREQSVASGKPALEEISFSLASDELEPEDREALSGVGSGQMTGVIESPDDFHFYVFNLRAGDTVKAGLVSAPKPRLEEWLEANP